jgi:hypothetical protein
MIDGVEPPDDGLLTGMKNRFSMMDEAQIELWLSNARRESDLADPDEASCRRRQSE